MGGKKNTTTREEEEEERDDNDDESALKMKRDEEDVEEMCINAISFNHDASCVVVSTGTGFRIVRVDSGEVVHRFDTIGPMRACELLRNTRLVACVGNGGGMDTGAPDLSPRRLKILNVDWQTLIADLAFRTTIRNVKMNRHVLVVCEDEETTVFEMKGLTKVMNVPQRKNVKGIAAINSDAVNACDWSGTKKSNDEEEIKEGETTTTNNNNNNNNNSYNSYLAVVSHLSETTIVIYDLHNVHVATEIRNAHEGPVAMLAFSQKGNILASCSVKGTVVRTWDVPSGEPRNIFRRGSTTAEITSLQFAYSIQNKCTFQPELLTVASDSGTAHVFQCFDNTNTSSRTSSEKEEGKEEENESNEEKKTKAIETKYASSSSSSSTAQKIVHMGGMVSKLALAGAKIVTKTSVNALAKVSNSVLHTSGISAKFTKSFLEPKRAAAVIKLPAPHKRMAATRNEKFAIGLGGSGESNVQNIDVVNNITADKSTIANGQTAAVSAPTSRVEWNVVTIRPEDFVTRTQNVGSSKNKSVALINMPPSLNPDDEDEGDTIDDMKRTTTQRVRVVCASSTGILYDYRVRLKRQPSSSSSSSSSSSQAVNTNDEVSKDDDNENKSPHLEAARSSSNNNNNNNNNNKSEYKLEREIYMLNAIGTAAGGSSSPSSSKVRFTGFSRWRRTSHQRRDTRREPEEEEEENALKFSMMQASQLRS